MSFFAELRRGYLDGRSGVPARPDPRDGFPPEEPPGGVGDQLAECKAVIAGLLAENASLKVQVAELQDECDRAYEAHTRSQENGQLLTQMRELKSIIAFPGARNALVKALHPDTGTGGDIRSRTAIFQRAMAVFEQLGVGR